MKTLEKFLTEHPSYCKCGIDTIADYSGIAKSTIVKFKKTEKFKEINKNYRNKF